MKSDFNLRNKLSKCCPTNWNDFSDEAFEKIQSEIIEKFITVWKSRVKCLSTYEVISSVRINILQSRKSSKSLQIPRKVRQAQSLITIEILISQNRAKLRQFSAPEISIRIAIEIIKKIYGNKFLLIKQTLWLND